MSFDTTDCDPCHDTINNPALSFTSQRSSISKTIDGCDSSVRSVQIDYKFTRLECRITAGASRPSSSEQTPEAQERRRRQNLEKLKDVMELRLSQWRKDNVQNTVVRDKIQHFKIKILDCCNHIHSEKIKMDIGKHKKVTVENDNKAILNDLAKTRSDSEHLATNMQNLNTFMNTLETSLEKHNLECETSSIALEKRLSEYNKMRDEYKNWQKKLQNINQRIVQATDSQKRALNDLDEMKTFSQVLGKQKISFMRSLQTIKKGFNYIAKRHDEMVGELSTVDIKEKFLENLINEQNESINEIQNANNIEDDTYKHHVGGISNTPAESGPKAEHDGDPLTYISNTIRSVLFCLLPSFPAPEGYQ